MRCFWGSLLGSFMPHVCSPARLFPCFSSACRFAQSNVLFVTNPWAKRLHCVYGVQRCFPVGSREVPCWWLAQELQSLNLGTCPSVQHLCMLLRRLQGCECPSLMSSVNDCAPAKCSPDSAVLQGEPGPPYWGAQGPQASQEFIKRCSFCLQPSAVFIILLSPLFLLPENVELLWLFMGILLFNLFCDGHLCVCVCV